MRACCYVNEGGHTFGVECGTLPIPLFGEHVMHTDHAWVLFHEIVIIGVNV